MLRDFLRAERGEILARARARVSARNAPVATEVELTQGLPVFLDQLDHALRRASMHEQTDHEEIQMSASQHGRDLFQQGLTAAQVVHDYGDLCQVITGLAQERGAPICIEEFRTLNLCLDDAIAGAVTAFAHQRERAIADAGTERLGILAHEMRNALGTALLTFESVKRGVVGPGGSTSAMLEQSLIRLSTLIDRSLADVRLDTGKQNLARIPVWEVVEEMVITASVVAQKRGVRFAITPVDRTVFVHADRQILAAAVANLVQNALKFTRVGTTVRLKTSATESRVLIDIEDECGGLPPGKTTELLRPFSQSGGDRTGLGLGLSICLKAVTAINGDLRIRDVPGHGCVFSIDLPKQPPPPTPMHGDESQEDQSGAGGLASRTG